MCAFHSEKPLSGKVFYTVDQTVLCEKDYMVSYIKFTCPAYYFHVYLSVRTEKSSAMPFLQPENKR